MGNCIVTVQVTGAHHNGLDSDIDQMAADFVEGLKAKGHSIQSASVVSGAVCDLMNSARFPLRSVNPEFYNR